MEVLEMHSMWKNMLVMIDTNALYYAGGMSDEISVREFWKELTDPANKIRTYVSDVVIQEFEVKSYSMLPRVKEKIESKLLPKMRTLRYTGSMNREHKLRVAAAYVKERYQLRVPSSGKLMTVLSTNDARIMLTALDNGCVIATYNVKDFLIYQCFGGRLWNPVTNQEESLSEEMLKEMEADEKLQKMLNEIQEMYDQ
jgi:rRNA-processing protein FCF1